MVVAYKESLWFAYCHATTIELAGETGVQPTVGVQMEAFGDQRIDASQGRSLAGKHGITNTRLVQ